MMTYSLVDDEKEDHDDNDAAHCLTCATKVDAYCLYSHVFLLAWWLLFGFYHNYF